MEIDGSNECFASILKSQGSFNTEAKAPAALLEGNMVFMELAHHHFIWKMMGREILKIPLINPLMR